MSAHVSTCRHVSRCWHMPAHPRCRHLIKVEVIGFASTQSVGMCRHISTHVGTCRHLNVSAHMSACADTCQHNGTVSLTAHLSPRVQSVCLLFVTWQSDHFWLSFNKFHIWPWKFKAKITVKVKSDGHIWALEFNRYVCFSFRGNCTIFGWDIANLIFDLENSRSRSWRKSPKI